MSSMHENTLHLLALCRIPGLDWHLIAREALRPRGLDRLLSGRFHEASPTVSEARDILRKDLPRLADLGAEVERMLQPVEVMGIRLTTVLDDDYPPNLRLVFNPPPFLFYRGTLRPEEDARSVAVVGTRVPSADGLDRARKMARLLARRRVTVLSGLARGIDTAAHQAALQAGGRTVAVLGSGILRIYPAENAHLADAVAAQGAVVSQFWPTAPPATHTFPRRNITMSGMGQGTVVIEATATSGAKMQARLALEHGKKVFLLKSLVTAQPWARGYLKRGAIEVSEVADIVAHLRQAAEIRERSRHLLQLSLDLE